jgi:hypothetical protein
MESNYLKEFIFQPFFSSIAYGLPWGLTALIGYAFWSMNNDLNEDDKWRARGMAALCVLILLVPVCFIIRGYAGSFVKTLVYLHPPIIFGIWFGEIINKKKRDSR